MHISSVDPSDLRRKGLEEKRSKMRFPIQVSCVFCFPCGLGLSYKAGSTVDLSTEGVCIIAEDLPAPGQIMNVEIFLPRGHRSDLTKRDQLHATEEESLRLCGEGRVVWIDTKRSRFAAEMCFYECGHSLTPDQRESVAVREEKPS